MLATYRRALSLPGAWQFSATGFVARLPIAMIGLGIVLLISTETGSYALAGFLSATFQVAAAAGAIVSSRATDRLGQHRLLPWLALVNALALVAFVASVSAQASVLVQAIAVGIAGASQPAIGSMVRARWAFVATEPDRLRSAFALESIIDELIFTVGPLLTALLAFRVGLPMPLLAAAVIGVAGAMVLAVQRRTEPTPTAPESARAPRGGALRQPGMLLVVVSALGIGGVFGTYEVSVVAFTEQAGAPGASGVILGLWALGSMFAGIWFGARSWNLPLARQMPVLTGLLAVALIPAPFVRTVPLLAATTFLGAAAVAPALIATFSLTERLVPSRLLTEGLTWANSGLAIGFSAGTTVAGVVIDAFGTTVAFALPMASAGFAFLVSFAGRDRLLAASIGRPQPPPTVTWNADPIPGPAPGGVQDDPQQGSVTGG